jgi:hypothetical protein
MIRVHQRLNHPKTERKNETTRKWKSVCEKETKRLEERERETEM